MMIAREIEEQTAPRLPRRIHDDHDRIAFAQWCARVLGVEVEWIEQTTARGFEQCQRHTALVTGSPAMVAMVAGLIATYPYPGHPLACAPVRVLRVESLPGAELGS